MLGIECWEHVQCGTWWIVSLPFVNAAHTEQIESWCVQQFGYVDAGVVRSDQSHDYWFTAQDHALQCWLTWGAS